MKVFSGVSIRYLLLTMISICAAFFVTGCSKEHECYLEGRGQAKRDLAQGEYNVALPDGTRVPWEYGELLRKRYKIGVDVYSLPANPEAAESWVRGYNEMSSPAIEQKFGTNILKQTMADAEKLHDEAKAKH